MRALTLETGMGPIRADASRAIDISIPLQFGGPQPVHFGASPASAAALHAGDFVGEVGLGGSCNCEEYRLTPHCNGTHTECVGHVTRERVSVQRLAMTGPELALLLSVEPVGPADTRESADPAPHRGDRLVSAQALTAAWQRWRTLEPAALVIRTLPNDTGKLARVYEVDPAPPYFTQQAVEWIVAQDIAHLLIDLPSLDRSHDQGMLSGHRIFWGLPPGSRAAAQARRPDATLTELIYVPDAVPDGFYLLDLQLAPFVADATPSRPLLFPVTTS
jgi:kynurenine formamidase